MVTQPKNEGGLGLRNLKESNTVNGLKLVWRIASAQNSLWVKWIRMHLLRKYSFWSVKDKSNARAWMWRKILKVRLLAKDFHRVEVVGTHF